MADSESAERTRLDQRVITLWSRQGLLVAAVLLLGAVAGTVWTALADGPAAAVGASGLLATVLVGAFAVWFPARRYDHWSYRLDPVALEIWHGAFIRRRSVIPYFRVQHVDTSRGPLERGLGLARLKIHTASSGTDATIPGINEATAANLRIAIVSRAGLREGV